MKTIRMWNPTGCRLTVSLLFFVLALQTGISTAFADDMVRRAQEALTEKGFDPGPADGMWGPKTKAGVMKFQESEGLTASGELDEETKNRLLGSMAETAPMAASAPASSQPASSAERMPEGDTGSDVPDSEIVWGRHK